MTHSFQMLNHPFYRDWMEGKLKRIQLQRYSVEYLPFVDAFPRFVSAVHSLCEAPSSRLTLLENLMDEEGRGHTPPHPELWRDFVAALETPPPAEPSRIGRDLRDRYLELCRSSYERGLGALHAYESQIPEIARAKIDGLATHYGITDEKDIRFFVTHETADRYHSEACAQLIENLPAEKKADASEAAEEASRLLWNFLTKVHAA